jgi:hypothetical protein
VPADHESLVQLPCAEVRQGIVPFASGATGSGNLDFTISGNSRPVFRNPEIPRPRPDSACDIDFRQSSTRPSRRSGTLKDPVDCARDIRGRIPCA